MEQTQNMDLLTFVHKESLKEQTGNVDFLL
jgi:hypothetical protein